jgi:hypothetical protein
MSKTKRCPACQKELPILAVRCKYCGFKLSNKPIEEQGDNEKEHGKAPMVRMSSIPPPPPPARKPAPTSPRAAKKTMMMGVADLPPKPARSSKKTMAMGAKDLPPRPAGMGKSGPGPVTSDRTTMPPPPISRPSVSDVDFQLDLEDLKPEEDIASAWIPETDELGDQSVLLELDPDDSSVIEIDGDLGGSLTDIHDENDLKLDDDDGEDDEDDEDETGNFLFKYVFLDTTLDKLEDKKWPAILVKVLGKVKYVYLIGAGAALFSIFALVVILAVLGGDEQDIPELPQVGGSAGEQAKPGDGKAEQEVKTPKPEPVADVDVGKSSGTVPDPGKICRPLDQYPGIAWRDKLSTVAGKLGANSVCAIFGNAPSKVAAAFGDLPVVGPGGLDEVRGGGLIEVFPTGTANRRGPSMEFAFVGDHLFEVRLKYRDTEGKDVGEKMLTEVFGNNVDSGKDFLGRKFVRFMDGDVVIELIEEKWYGRTLKTIVLASAQIREFLAPEREKIKDVIKSMVAGDALFGKWKFDDALVSYRKAADEMPEYGAAHVKQALMLARLEKFEEVEMAAKKALEVSAEKSVRAEALGLLGVTALFNGSTDNALEYFKQAASTDPANEFFRMSAREIETGEYATDRVARTAARMECLKKKGYKSTPKGLLARGNFPDMKTYFKKLQTAKSDPKFAKLKKDASRGECR